VIYGFLTVHIKSVIFCGQFNTCLSASFSAPCVLFLSLEPFLSFSCTLDNTSILRSGGRIQRCALYNSWALTSFTVIIGISLLLNHSPSEWFSVDKKIAVSYNGDAYMLKFPPSGEGKPTELPYTNSCISEHIASSIMGMLGIRVQEMAMEQEESEPTMTM